MTATGPPAPAWHDRRVEFINVPFDPIAADDVLDILRGRSHDDRFAYVVTPNVDHVIRLARAPGLIGIYRDAWMSWCDSRPLRRLARMRGTELPLVTGSDMVARLFGEVVRPGDRLACITASDDIIAALRTAFPHCRIAGWSPPPDVDTDPAAFDACAEFIIAHPARFVFICIGAPRSERLAHAVLHTGRASGTAFCVGAALEFITGRKKRAPFAMRRLGLEWLHRLASEPRRLWRRYVFGAWALCGLVAREFLRPRRGQA